MARYWTITRTEAENLVDLLEDCDQKIVGTWRHDLAAQLRDLFGMISLEEEKKNKVIGIMDDDGNADYGPFSKAIIH